MPIITVSDNKLYLNTSEYRHKQEGHNVFFCVSYGEMCLSSDMKSFFFSIPNNVAHEIADFIKINIPKEIPAKPNAIILHVKSSDK